MNMESESKETRSQDIKLALEYANAIIGTLREPFLVLDKNLRIISTNQSFYASFQVIERETIGKLLSDLGNGQWNIPQLISLLKEILPQKTIVTDYEVQHNFKQIGHRIMNLNARQLRIPKKLAIAITEKEKEEEEEEEEELILLAIEDVTDRKKIEKQLIESEAQDEVILSSIGDGVMACDHDGRILLFNSMAEALTGFSAEEAIGEHYGKLLRFIKEEDNTPSADFISEALKTGRKTKIAPHTSLIRKDGLKIPVADSAAPIKLANGTLVGVVVVFRDITYDRSVDRAKTEFVSLASHQLRSPLSIINWYVELLLGGDAGKLVPFQKKYLTEIYKGSKRMGALVEALLNVSRLELGVFAVAPVPTDLAAAVKFVIAEHRRDISKKELKLALSLDASPKISLDPKLFNMIIDNLVTNAIKYTPNKGRLSITAGLRRVGSELGGRRMSEDSMFLSVKDNGIGIPGAFQDKIFTKLFRADNARVLSPEGTGLGLYIAKMIVDYALGMIWFESVEGKGTTFYVVLPLRGMEPRDGMKKLT